MARNARTVFLDANVLAAPVTRTMLLVGIEAIDVVAVWSRQAEDEANRHLRPHAMRITTLRTTLLGADLSATGNDPSRFTGTKKNDRQILADAVAANAAFLITSDVNDFAETDLEAADVAAANPDLFMAMRFSVDAYQRALNQLIKSLKNPPKSVAQMHALVSRKHPRLHRRFARLYPDEPDQAAMHAEPRVLYRGARCIICGRTISGPSRLTLGCHPTCLAQLTPTAL